MSVDTPPPGTHNSRADRYRPEQCGCTARGCGTQDTVVLSPHVGRRCSAHPPIPWAPVET